MRGPIDFIIVGFEGNKFNGDILQALNDAMDQGIIDLIALSVIQKNEAGIVTILDTTKTDEELIFNTNIRIPHNTLITEEDIEEMGDLLNGNTVAGLLIIEHLWAKPLKQALISSGGTLVADGRIHPDADAELNEEE